MAVTSSVEMRMIHATKIKRNKIRLLFTKMTHILIPTLANLKIWIKMCVILQKIIFV